MRRQTRLDLPVDIGPTIRIRIRAFVVHRTSIAHQCHPLFWLGILAIAYCRTYTASAICAHTACYRDTEYNEHGQCKTKVQNKKGQISLETNFSNPKRIFYCAKRLNGACKNYPAAFCVPWCSRNAPILHKQEHRCNAQHNARENNIQHACASRR